jgi:hypothetical protein
MRNSSFLSLLCGNVFAAILSLSVFAVFATPSQAQTKTKYCAGGPKNGKDCTADPTICGTDDKGDAFECTNDNNITVYAIACYQKLEIKPLSETVRKGKVYQCKDGYQLVTSRTAGTPAKRRILDIYCPKDLLHPELYEKCVSDGSGKNRDRLDTFPDSCDFPTWLPNSGKQCYGNSYLQKLSGFTGLDGKPNEDVTGALQCRKKSSWDDGDKNFTDIAMIFQNKKNGQTCWFQTNDSACTGTCTGDLTKSCKSDSDCAGKGTCKPDEPRCDGTHIPAPETAEGEKFWWQPYDTAKLNCVRCHDNGPWMNSRWIDNTINTKDKKADPNKANLKDGPNRPYKNEGWGIDVAINVHDGTRLPKKWLEPAFTTIARDGFLPPNTSARTCTACHQIHDRAHTPDKDPYLPFENLGIPGSGNEYQTFLHWLDWSTGQAIPPQSTFDTPAKIKDGTGFQIAYWMPPGHGLDNADDWDKTYLDDLNLLKACMDKQGKGGKCVGGANDGKACGKKSDCPGEIEKGKPAQCVGPCRERLASLNPNPSPDKGAWIASNFSPRQYVSDPPNDASPYPLAAGSAPVISWGADASFVSCAIEATFPPGVVSPNLVTTASNWSLADQFVDIGPLDKDGFYRFDLYCDGEMSASLTYTIGNTSPTLLRMQAIMNQVGAEEAHDGTYIKSPTYVTTTVHSTDSVDLWWVAEGVKDNGCVVVGAGISYSTDESGFLTLSLIAGQSQTFNLNCVGDDGHNYAVQVTIGILP